MLTTNSMEPSKARKKSVKTPRWHNFCVMRVCRRALKSLFIAVKKPLKAGTAAVPAFFYANIKLCAFFAVGLWRLVKAVAECPAESLNTGVAAKFGDFGYGVFGFAQ